MFKELNWAKRRLLYISLHETHLPWHDSSVQQVEAPWDSYFFVTPLPLLAGQLYQQEELHFPLKVPLRNEDKNFCYAKNKIEVYNHCQ